MRYQAKAKDDDPLRQRLRKLAVEYPCYDYQTLHPILKREGLVINEKRTYRMDELAFYDALETNDCSVQVLGEETLRESLESWSCLCGAMSRSTGQFERMFAPTSDGWLNAFCASTDTRPTSRRRRRKRCLNKRRCCLPSGRRDRGSLDAVGANWTVRTFVGRSQIRRDSGHWKRLTTTRLTYGPNTSRHSPI